MRELAIIELAARAHAAAQRHVELLWTILWSIIHKKVTVNTLEKKKRIERPQRAFFLVTDQKLGANRYLSVRSQVRARRIRVRVRVCARARHVTLPLACVCVCARLLVIFLEASGF